MTAMNALRITALALAIGLFATPSLAGSAPTVVELFTSQGCNSCPPADEFLGELVERDDVIALSYHIDYWDYLGWRDTFSSEASTERQRKYARYLGANSVYTPQMVIGGRAHAVGSRRGDVERAITRVAQTGGDHPEVSFVHGEAGNVTVRIGEAERPERSASVWLVRFDEAQSVPIKSGENAGRTITYHHIVRDIERIGRWRGPAAEFPLAMADLSAGGRDGCAVLVQIGDQGPVIGAAQMKLVVTAD